MSTPTTTRKPTTAETLAAIREGVRAAVTADLERFPADTDRALRGGVQDSFDGLLTVRVTDALAAIHDAVEAAASRWLHSGEPLPVNSLQDGVESAFREWLDANTSELIQAIAEKATQPPAAA